jgi:hypothetical protein
MANRTSRHLDFLVDHLHIVHVVCIFVDFGYCMDPLTWLSIEVMMDAETDIDFDGDFLNEKLRP